MTAQVHGDVGKNPQGAVVVVGVMDPETDRMTAGTIVVLVIVMIVVLLCVGMTAKIAVVIVTVMIVDRPCVGMIVTAIRMTVDQELAVLGSQVQAKKEPLGATEKSKKSNNGRLPQEMTNLGVVSKTADPLVNVMTEDHHLVTVMIADHLVVTAKNVEVVVEEAGVMLLVKNEVEVDLNEGMIVVMIVVHPCVEMTAEKTVEEVAEVGEVHREMTADHHQCVGMTVDHAMIVDHAMTAEVMTAEEEGVSVVAEVTAIAEMTVDRVRTVETTGVQDLVDFHPRHVEVMIDEKTVVKDSLQGMRDLLSVHQNLRKGVSLLLLLMVGPLLNVVNVNL
jgi:hypothetical protein